MWFLPKFAKYKFKIFSNREKGCQTNMKRPTWSVSAMQHSSPRNASAVQGRRSYPNLKSPKSEAKEKFKNIFRGFLSSAIWDINTLSMRLENFYILLYIFYKNLTTNVFIHLIFLRFFKAWTIRLRNHKKANKKVWTISTV